MANLLLVVDMQNGFVNNKTKHIVSGIETLIDYFAKQQLPVAFTRFINRPEGPHVKWIGWSRFMAEPEINLIDNFRHTSEHVFDKKGYTAFTEEFEGFLRDRSINKIFLCGIATDGCILKTAVDSFERNIKPVVVKDACASHAGDEVHNAGLLLISRFIGKRQITTIKQVIEAE
ncbi:MAG: isochorismatase family cysteine hydrolase [Ardenticatenaceae bacterium]